MVDQRKVVTDTWKNLFNDFVLPREVPFLGQNTVSWVIWSLLWDTEQRKINEVLDTRIN